MSEAPSAPDDGLADNHEPMPAELQSPEDTVPAWLAVLVLVLLLLVMGVGGFVLRGVIAGRSPVRTAAEYQIDQAKRNLVVNPQQADAHLQLAYAYQEDGKYDKALAEYAKALTIDPKNTAAYYNKGLIYERLGISDKALSAFWAVLNIDPTHELAAKELGKYYAAHKEYRSLVIAVRPAAEARPEMADLQYLLGFAYENIGHPDWAAERYRMALRYVPDMAEAKAGLIRLGAKP